MTTEGNLCVAVIDDEPAIRRLTRVILEAEGLMVIDAPDGKEGLRIIAYHTPDVVLLDLGLPDLDGKEVLGRMREWSETPVIVLTVRDAPEEKIAALDAGADDYVTKPFHAGELLARIRAVTKRHRRCSTGTTWEHGTVMLDLVKRTVTVNQKPISLTPTEYNLLRILVKNEGCVLTKRALIEAAWGSLSKTVTEDILRVHLAALRRKLREQDPACATLISTEQGVGYRLG